jgi:hypothetical protein
MDERRYQLEIFFLETEALRRTISESERERLYFDLILGGGEYIAGTGRLERIRCGSCGHRGRKGREVVFAEYRYPVRKKWIFLLLNEFPLPSGRRLSKEEKKVLRQLKAKADRYVERFCERLDEEEPNG